MASLVGKWHVVVKSALGTSEADWDIKEEGGVYSGTLASDGNVSEWKSIVVDGDHFESDIALPLPFGLIDFHFSGDIGEDEITGISKMKMGKSKFKGKRI